MPRVQLLIRIHNIGIAMLVKFSYKKLIYPCTFQTPVTPAESMKSAVELGPIEISVYESSVEDNETDSEIIAAAE